MLLLNCKECSKEFTPYRNCKLFCSAFCRSKRRRKDFQPVHKLSNIKARARRKGLEFNLTEEDLQTPTICPILGIPLYLFNQSDNSPSVDRIDNTKGYVKGNVRVISNRANTLKSNATIEELELILADARKLCL